MKKVREELKNLIITEFKNLNHEQKKLIIDYTRRIADKNKQQN